MSQRNEEKYTTKKELVELGERIVHQFKTVSEKLIRKIEIVAEGMTNVHENMGRVEKRLTEKIDSVGVDLSAVIRVSYIDLTKRVDDFDRRVKELEKIINH